MHPNRYKEKPQLLKRFQELASNIFTFVPTWKSDPIDNYTFRLFGKKKPAKAATNDYMVALKASISPELYQESKCKDLEKKRDPVGEWLPASDQTSLLLHKNMKELWCFIFYKGVLYEVTYNDGDNFSQSQLCLMFDVPSKADIDQEKPVKVLVAPPGVKDFSRATSKSKVDYEAEGWVETLVKYNPEYIQELPNNLQGFSPQYGLKHRNDVNNSCKHGRYTDTNSNGNCSIRQYKAEYMEQRTTCGWIKSYSSSKKYNFSWKQKRNHCSNDCIGAGSKPVD